MLIPELRDETLYAINDDLNDRGMVCTEWLNLFIKERPDFCAHIQIYAALAARGITAGDDPKIVVLSAVTDALHIVDLELQARALTKLTPSAGMTTETKQPWYHALIFWRNR